MFWPMTEPPRTARDRAVRRRAPGRAGGAPEPRDAARARLGRGGPGQPERRGAPRGDPPHAADGQEAMAGRLAAPRRHPDGPDHALGRRHARPGAAALRQGAAAGPRRPARGDGRDAAPDPGRRGLRLPHLRRDRGRGARGLGHSGGGGVDRVSRRALAVPAAARRDPGVGGRRAPRRSTSSSPGRTC